MPDIVFPLTRDIAQQSLRHDGLAFSVAGDGHRGESGLLRDPLRAEGDAALLQNAHGRLARILLIAGGTALLHTHQNQEEGIDGYQQKQDDVF